MTPRDHPQRLLIEHRTAHDPASSQREILRLFDEAQERPKWYEPVFRQQSGECICIKCGLRQDGPREEPTF